MLCAWEGLEIVSARTLLTLSHVPQRTPGQSTENPPVSPPNTEQLPAALPLCRGLAFTGPAQEGLPPPPPQKQAWVGLHRLSRKECNYGWGRRRLQRAVTELEQEV